MTTDYSASAESRLSLPVAARVQTFPVVSPLEAANLPSLLQLHYSLDGRRRRRASLRFDSGPLCPSALLGADLFVGEDYDNKIYAILDAQPTSPDDVMLRAARALRVAAARAAVDVGGLDRRAGSPSAPDADPALPPRADLALRLLLSDGDGSDGRCCAHLSAAQLLLSEIESRLESLAPPRRADSRATNWRMRDLLRSPPVRSALGPPLALILHVLIGPLNGVCLRNLVWHGYVGPGELERSQWSYLLFLLVAFGLPPAPTLPGTVMSEISDGTAHATRKRKRPRNSPLERPGDSAADDGGDLSIWVPGEAAVDSLLSASPPFVPPPARPAFREAMRLCRGWRPSSSPPRFCGNDGDDDAALLWRALALLYVTVEGGLRARFARENPSLQPNPEIATMETLHFTMSTMMRSTVSSGGTGGGSSCDDDNEDAVGGARSSLSAVVPNGLLAALGKAPVGALYDEFVWMGLPDASLAANAPRQGVREPLPCRNELVHGTLQLHAVSPVVVARMVRLAVGLVAQSLEATSNQKMVDIDPVFDKCVQWIQQYQPKRHPACQVWVLFRSVCFGDRKSRITIMDEMIPVQIEVPEPNSHQKVKPKDGIVDTIPPSKHISVKYCPICSFPLEYCCYTRSAVQCLERRSGPANTASIPVVTQMAMELVKRLRSRSTPDMISAEELLLAVELEDARQKLIPVAGIGGVMANERNLWSVLDSAPARRSTPEIELGKLWMLREAVARCGEISERVYRRLLWLLALAAKGEDRVKIGSKKQPILSVTHRLTLTLLGTEVVLLVALQQFHASDMASPVLATFLSIFASTLSNHLERGRFRMCVGMTASLLSGGFGNPSSIEQLIKELPRSDRDKYVLNLGSFLQYAANRQPFVESIVVKNQFALKNGSKQLYTVSDKLRQEAANNEELCPETGANGASWESLRRWRRISIPTNA